jgi:hypothetical protein
VRHFLVGPGRRLRAMPGAAIGIRAGVRRVGQRLMHRAALVRRRAAVGGGPHERVPEADAQADLEQAGALRLGGRRRPDPDRVRRTEQQARVAHRLGRRGQQEPLGVGRQRPQAPGEGVLDLPLQRQRVRQPEPAGQGRRAHPVRELEQGERIAPRLRDDPVADPLVERPWECRAQEHARIGGGQAVQDEVGQPGELLAGVRQAHGEDHAQRFGQQPAGDERQRLGGCHVEPLRVVDEAQERPFLGDLRQQAEDRETDEEPVGRVSLAQPERRRQRGALRPGQVLEPIEHRCAELMQPRERQLHLGLHPGRSRQPAIGGPLGQIAQQRGLPDPRLAPQHEAPALARAHHPEQLVELRALLLPPPQRRFAAHGPNIALGSAHPWGLEGTSRCPGLT